MGTPMQGMGIYGIIGVLGFVLGLAKEIFIIVLLFQGIRLANIFIKKSRNEEVTPENDNRPPMNMDQEEKDNLDE